MTCCFEELTHSLKEIGDTLYNAASPEQLTHKEDKTTEKSGNDRERKFILQILDTVANLFLKVCFHNW